MPQIAVYKCDGCGTIAEKIRSDSVSFDWSKITEESKQVRKTTDDGWLITARPIPTDPIGITHEYFCPDCNPDYSVPDDPKPRPCPECGTEGSVESRKYGDWCYECDEYVYIVEEL